MTTYRFVGTHVEDLDDGSVLEPLQEVTLDTDAQGGTAAQRLIGEGLLLEIKPAGKAAKEGG